MALIALLVLWQFLAQHPVPWGLQPSGRLVAARSFKRLNGVLLVMELLDGSPGTIPIGHYRP